MKRWVWLLVGLLVVAGCGQGRKGELATAVSPSPTAQLAAATATETAVSPTLPVIATSTPAPTPVPTPAPTPTPLKPLEVTPAPTATLRPTPIFTPVSYPTPSWSGTPAQMPPAGLVYTDPESLWQITAGGQKRQLWTRFPVTLSPDGQRALYQDEETLVIADLTTGAENALDLSGYSKWCCAVWGGNEMILLGTLPEGEEWGQSFGYLTAVSLDGSWQKVLDPEQKYGTYPALSPDGRTIAYGMGSLAYLDGRVETFDAAAFTGFPAIPNVAVGSPAWSPDGTKLTWYIAGPIGEQREHMAAVAVFNLAEQTAVILHPYKNLGRGGWFNAPVWSPDGRWLAFIVEAEDFSQNGVWVAAADGSEEHFLGGMGGHSLVWSPDGRRLVFAVWDMTERKNVVLLADMETWTAVPLDLPAGARAVYWAVELYPERP